MGSIKSWQKNEKQTWKKRSVKHKGIAYMQNILEVFAYLHMINLFSSTCCLLDWNILIIIFIVAGCSSCISRSINLPRHWGPIARLNNPFLEQDLKSSEQSNQLVLWDEGWTCFTLSHNIIVTIWNSEEITEITAMALFLLRHRHDKTP